MVYIDGIDSILIIYPAPKALPTNIKGALHKFQPGDDPYCRQGFKRSEKASLLKSRRDGSFHNTGIYSGDKAKC